MPVQFFLQFSLFHLLLAAQQRIPSTDAADSSNFLKTMVTGSFEGSKQGVIDKYLGFEIL